MSKQHLLDNYSYSFSPLLYLYSTYFIIRLFLLKQKDYTIERE
ncbi:hypothetical protein FM106_13140 [Brachybacterium faecium]|nr:hypothetical protein FM106_13140 [Brachybacterium faecium]